MQDVTDQGDADELQDAVAAAAESAVPSGDRESAGKGPPVRTAPTKSDARSVRLAAALKANIGRRKAAGRVVPPAKPER